MKPSGLAVPFLGASLSRSGLWVITPAVLTVLSWGLIGTMNAMGPVWKRLSNCAETLGIKLFWYDLDTNKNIIDYLTYLRIRPEGPVEPITPPKDISRKFHLSVFSYPAVLAGSIATTCFADYPGAPAWLRLYIYGCAAAQGLYSIRIWYRAVCRFFGIRKEQTEV